MWIQQYVAGNTTARDTHKVHASVVAGFGCLEYSTLIRSSDGLGAFIVLGVSEPAF